ncbi:triple QxxK/R motif-containing protein isoform X2 [Malaclemys terrapin pileata]|uniref:triple QxxK/R motif-containing protein isoform X2 n=1 Tax=Malaclemys terrapin pileata TaxID=2991368 RepID=UPI0023A812DE|nr:triple QxxK/R motif-containing protein isoform X2 [Malaclemys terrapin pileata]
MRGWVPQGDTGARTSRLALRLGRGRWSPPPPGCPRRRRWDCPGLCAERLGSPVAAVGGPTPRSPPSGGRRRRSSPAQPRRRTWFVPTWSPQRDNTAPVVLDSKRMGRKDASAARIPVEQYRKQIALQVQQWKSQTGLDDPSARTMNCEKAWPSCRRSILPLTPGRCDTTESGGLVT